MKRLFSSVQEFVKLVWWRFPCVDEVEISYILYQFSFWNSHFVIFTTFHQHNYNWIVLVKYYAEDTRLCVKKIPLGKIWQFYTFYKVRRQTSTRKWFTVKINRFSMEYKKRFSWKLSLNYKCQSGGYIT